MSELIIAVFIVILSQYILKVLIEPFIDFKKVLSEISYLTLSNQSSIVSSNELNMELGTKFRHLSARLLKSYDSIFGYWILRLFSCFTLPSETDVITACGRLNLLYSELSFHEKKDYAQIENSLNIISRHLKIRTRYSSIK